MEKRLGCVSVILDRQTAPITSVNELLSRFGDCFLARLGLPYPSHGVNIITLVTDSSTDRLSSLTGKLGKLPGVQVKSLLSKFHDAGVLPDVAPSEQRRPD
ncbi:MAG: iron-only hydrogenase system regulator [Planctomycetaceae bacterium]|nr:iron-only hydrogenase system regulator [Planctomycetaceae bacterium]